MSKLSFLEFLDNIGKRRLERHRIAPRRPLDTRMLVGVLFFAGYYALLWRLMSARGIPDTNIGLIKDAMLILGPVIGAIGQALFRTDVKDEIATQNTGEAFRAQAKQAEATIAAVAAPAGGGDAQAGADAVANAATDKAEEISRSGGITEGPSA